MPRIPTGQPDSTFGNDIARAQRGVTPSPQALGAGVGQAIAQVAGQQFDRLANEQAQREAEARQQQAIAQREAEAAAREANRVKALTATAQVQNSLGALADEIATGLADGTTDKTNTVQQFQERSAKILENGISGVDSEHRDLVRAQLLDNIGRTEREVRKLVTARDRLDLRDGTNAYIEEMQRYAARGGAQTDEAIGNVEAYVNSVAAAAGLDAQRTVQGFKERVRFRQAADMVQANPVGALNMLRDKNTLPEIDPDRRAALMTQAQGMIDQANARAEIAQQKRFREAEAAFKTYSMLADKGTLLNADYTERVLRQVEGTPFHAGVRALNQQATAVGGLAAQPIAQQRAMLQAIDAEIAQKGRTPELDQRRQQVEKVVQASESDYSKDPLAAGLERGVITQLTPLNVRDVNGLAAALQKRGDEAARVSIVVGRVVSPLTAAESTQVRTLLNALAPDQKAAAIAQISTTVGSRQAVAMAKQMDSQDKALAFAMAAGAAQTTQGRYTAEVILRGAQALKDKQIKDDNTVTTGVRMNIAKEVGDMLPGQARDDVIEAARLIYYGMQSTSGVSASYKNAVRLAMGQDIIERGGKKLPVPVGMDEDKFSSALNAAASARLKGMVELRAGGVPVSADQVLQALPSASLMPVGRNRYALQAGSGALTDARGNLVIIEVPESVTP